MATEKCSKEPSERGPYGNMQHGHSKQEGLDLWEVRSCTPHVNRGLQFSSGCLIITDITIPSEVSGVR